MIKIEIPGFRVLQLAHLVLDYNGTLAVNGDLIEGVKPRLISLADSLNIHVITADTFGKATNALDGVDCQLVILPPGNQAVAKADYVRQLGVQATVTIGNGRNDRLMLEQAVLGIAVLGEEGAASATIMAADIVIRDMFSGYCQLVELQTQFTRDMRCLRGLGCLLGARHLLPGSEGLRTDGPGVGGGQEMPTQAKQIIDGSVGR